MAPCIRRPPGTGSAHLVGDTGDEPGATPRPGRLTSPARPRLSRLGRGQPAVGLSSASLPTRHDNHRPMGVLRHLPADRAHHHPPDATGPPAPATEHPTLF